MNWKQQLLRNLFELRLSLVISSIATDLFCSLYYSIPWGNVNSIMWNLYKNYSIPIATDDLIWSVCLSGQPVPKVSPQIKGGLLMRLVITINIYHMPTCVSHARWNRMGVAFWSDISWISKVDFLESNVLMIILESSILISLYILLN